MTQKSDFSTRTCRCFSWTKCSPNQWEKKSCCVLNMVIFPLSRCLHQHKQWTRPVRCISFRQPLHYWRYKLVIASQVSADFKAVQLHWRQRCPCVAVGTYAPTIAPFWGTNIEATKSKIRIEWQFTGGQEMNWHSYISPLTNEMNWHSYISPLTNEM